MRILQVRVIDSDGQQRGILDTRDGIAMAQEAGLDLVLIAPNADPPVAKIVDYGRHKYEQDKVKKDQKRKVQEVKGIKVSPNIAEHDIQVSIRKARQFLEEGNKVRLVCRFRRRELAYPKRGEDKLEYIAEQLQEISKRDRDPLLNGNEMVMVLNPISSGGQKKNAKTENEENSDEAV